MILLIIVILIIVIGVVVTSITDNEKWLSISGVGVAFFFFLAIALISKPIINKNYPIEYGELKTRIEKCEYSEQMKRDIYNHNMKVKKNIAWKDNKFIGLYYPKSVSKLPLIEYHEVSQENKITLIKGE